MSASPLPLETRPLSQVERVVDIFFAPSQTFLDLLRSATWWLPCILVIVFATFYGSTAIKKVGLATMTDNMIHSMSRLEDMVQNDKTQAAAIRSRVSSQLRTGFYSTPISYVVGGFAVAGLFLVTTNFIFGGQAGYMQMVAVFWYSLLPLLLWYLLIIVLLYAGVNLEAFQAANPIGTNIGYYMTGSSPALVATLNCFDVFSLWIFALQGIGMARVARISVGKGLASAAIWWIVYSGVFKVLPLALFG